MSSLQSILSSFDQSDLNEYLKNLTDNEYIGSKSGNTILHIMAILKEKFNEYRTKILTILINKTVNVNKLNKRRRTCIHEALKYFNYDFVKLVIENSDIDLSVIDDKNNDAFIFACERNNYEIASMIVDKVKSININSINSIRNLEERNMLLEKIYHKFYNDEKELPTEIPEFKIYNEKDFNIRIDSIKGSGTYGVVNIAIEKESGREVVIKRFKLEYNDLYLPTSAIRDIVFLQTLNRYGGSTKIYGIMIDNNNNFYMVMEHLDKILTSKIKFIYNFDIVRREKEYLKLIYNILTCIDFNSKAGIIHCDTKEDNIMTDNEGRIRYIDYGFSYYLGISPYLPNINDDIHIGNYLMKDGTKSTDTICNFKDENTGRILFSIHKGYTGLNIDISSVAFMILWQTIRKNDNLYGSYNGKIYNKIRHINNSDDFLVSQSESDTYRTKMVDAFGQKLTDLLIRMMSIDSRERPNAKTLMNDPIFGKTKLRIPENIELVPLNYSKSNNMSEMIIYQMSARYNTESQNQYIRSGFVYYDEIYNHWKDETVTMMKDDFNHGNIFAKCFALASKHKISMDSFFNAIYYKYDLIERGLSKDTIDYNELIYIIMLYSKIYDDNDFDDNSVIYEIMAESGWSKNMAKTFIEKIFNSIKRDPNFYIMKPTMLFVNYIKFILQAVCKDESTVSDIMSSFHIELYKEITGQKDLDTKIKISDIVKNVYDRLPNKIPIIFPEV